MRRFTLAGVLTCFLLARGAHGAVPWHHPLYLDNGGYWPERVAVTITNGSAEPVAGERVLALSFPVLAGTRVSRCGSAAPMVQSCCLICAMRMEARNERVP